jgi:hypothetical protein
LEWLLHRGIALQAACEFANALKYCFAGKMYSARFNLLFPSSEKKISNALEEKFDKLYSNLLPMTNAEVIRTVLVTNSHRLVEEAPKRT